MIPLHADEIAEITGGRTHLADPTTVVTAPATVDSRNVEPGALFVGVVGDRVDGNDYAAAAVAAGAALALTTREVDAPCVVVDDSPRNIRGARDQPQHRRPQCRSTRPRCDRRHTRPRERHRGPE